MIANAIGLTVLGFGLAYVIARAIELAADIARNARRK
jgi:hypothetical protein